MPVPRLRVGCPLPWQPAKTRLPHPLDPVPPAEHPVDGYLKRHTPFNPYPLSSLGSSVDETLELSTTSASSTEVHMTRSLPSASAPQKLPSFSVSLPSLCLATAARSSMKPQRWVFVKLLSELALFRFGLSVTPGG